MRVLEQQGLLGEVDGDLLKRIQASIHGSQIKDKRDINSEIDRNHIENQLSTSPTVSALDASPVYPILQPASKPSDRLLQSGSNGEGKESEDPADNLLSSILITPTPTIFTIIDTTR